MNFNNSKSSSATATSVATASILIAVLVMAGSLLIQDPQSAVPVASKIVASGNAVHA